MIFFAVFGIASLPLEFGSFASPGPGLWPRLLIITGIIAAVAIAAFGRDSIVPSEQASKAKLLLYGGGIFLLPVMYNYIGFLIPAMLTLVVLFYFDSTLNLIKSVVLAAVVVTALYALFSYGLSLPLRPI
nr:tripartite tricarboxylate transporter TctB family protein [Corynebacterium lemuris]